MGLDIYCGGGVVKKVIYDGASQEQINWGGNNDPRGLLVVGNAYEIEDIDIHSYHTKIKLKGINGWFNDASFIYEG